MGGIDHVLGVLSRWPPRWETHHCTNIHRVYIADFSAAVLAGPSPRPHWSLMTHSHYHRQWRTPCWCVEGWGWSSLQMSRG
eukprot:2291520-Karenia_brevis.AAC.1